MTQAERDARAAAAASTGSALAETERGARTQMTQAERDARAAAALETGSALLVQTDAQRSDRRRLSAEEAEGLRQEAARQGSAILTAQVDSEMEY